MQGGDMLSCGNVERTVGVSFWPQVRWFIHGSSSCIMYQIQYRVLCKKKGVFPC